MAFGSVAELEGGGEAVGARFADEGHCGTERRIEIGEAAGVIFLAEHVAAPERQFEMFVVHAQRQATVEKAVSGDAAEFVRMCIGGLNCGGLGCGRSIRCEGLVADERIVGMDCD